jgi:hypothetical protein
VYVDVNAEPFIETLYTLDDFILSRKCLVDCCAPAGLAHARATRSMTDSTDTRGNVVVMRWRKMRVTDDLLHDMTVVR